MNKTFTKLSTIGLLSVATSILLSGCGGASTGVKAPVTEREQLINVKVMDSISSEYGEGKKKSFDESSEKGSVKLVKSSSLKDMGPELTELITPLIEEASKMFKARGLSEEVMAKAPVFLQGEPGTLKITLYTYSNSKGKKTFNASYTPFNDIYIQNFDISTVENKDKARFIIAHELGHAVAMHITEDESNVQDILDGGSEIVNIGLDIATNEAYTSISPEQQKILDIAAIKISQWLGVTDEEMKTDSKILAEREDSFAVKALKSSGNTEQLNKLGVSLQIPAKTRLVMKALLKSGLDASSITDMMSDTAKVALQSVVLVMHSQEQELEADKISQQILTSLNLPIDIATCTLFHSEKPAGYFDGHPSHPERLQNLNITCK